MLVSLERLDKILASQNCGSRKEVGVLIRRGAVTVNGVTVTKADSKADADTDKIAVNGEPINFKRNTYIMMNKPQGVLSAARDSRMKTVVDLLEPSLFRKGLFPAGRLDRDTEGLLILTDDGEFAHRMLAPKSHVFKLYHAVIDAPVTAADIKKFEQGVVLGDMTCLPAELIVLESGETPLVQIKIREGKFHQVKRMFRAVGKTVLRLKRVEIGQLQLDPNLAPGEARELSIPEKDSVFK
jgi:16S rRNA pseudouridine516 synthase